MDALNLTPDLTGPLRGPWVLVTAELSHFSNLPFYVCVFMRVFSWVCACVGVYACGNRGLCPVFPQFALNLLFWKQGPLLKAEFISLAGLDVS